MLKYFLFLFSLELFSFKASALTVLTYDSMMGKKSFGEYLAQQYKTRCADCVVEFVGTQDLSGIYNKLKKNPQKYDVVLGLDSNEYSWAQKEQLIFEGQVFEKSPMAIIVDTHKIPLKDFPKTWDSAVEKFQNKIFVQDPRLSLVGQSWLNQMFRTNIMQPESMNKIVSRVFPSWSAAYDRFLKEESLGVWTYLTSEAYHRCQNTQFESRYRAVRLKEGYVVQESWAAIVAQSPNKEAAKKFFEFLFLEEVQKEIPLRNFMYPGNSNVPLPKCFLELPQNWPLAQIDKQNFDKNKLREILDKWALLN